ncbi:hypothetical protein [Pseudomonas sp. NPDC088444]|uniref:hypothetical protein n=1 Tax=Pseudomonas sp. NPDC088444 TaxID=3364456 RepID=UPI00384E88F1
MGALISTCHGLLAPFNPWISGFGTALLIMGLLQKYWAIRVSFDAHLMQRLADHPQPLTDKTKALDHALTALALQPEEKAGRPWDKRIGNTLRLLRRQVTLLAAQIVLTLSFSLAIPWLVTVA